MLHKYTSAILLFKKEEQYFKYISLSFLWVKPVTKSRWPRISHSLQLLKTIPPPAFCFTGIQFILKRPNSGPSCALKQP